MKTRGPIQCGCGCRVTLPTGSQVSRYGGRLWATAHLIAYQRKRREGEVKGR